MAKLFTFLLVLAVAGWTCEARILKRDIQRDIPEVPLKPEPVEPKIEDVLHEESLKPTEGDNSNLKSSDDNEDDFEQPEGRVLYSGSQLWKTVVDSEEKVRVLAKLRDEEDISMWGGNVSAIDILVKPNAVDKVRNILSQERINYDVAIDDLQKAIDEENPPPEKEEENRNGHPLTWQSYHRVNDHHSYLDFLADQYPDLVKLQTIGSSVNGRPIKVIKISNGRAGNKAIWVDGGIHAREWITPATVTYIINQFVTNWEAEPKYVQNIDWYFAPMLNPDGYEYTHMTDRLWRKNRRGSGRCAGIDLNRNFGYRWGGSGSSKNPCAETYGGSGPFSEPETAAVQRFISGANAKWRAYVSFHSYGQYILYPWGYNRVVPPDYRDLEMVGQKAAQAIRNVGGPSYTVGPAGNTLYPAAGGSDDWAKGTMKMKYAYTIELRDNGRYGFVLPASYILPTAKEGLAAVRVIAEAASKA
ncbi:carboxypeptidase B-like [Anthonomus grandis grandis]|uniref:carboxypeptidase B-like n=1 Tax=Anthonomus grandis grandis TaxID=2921223 RepID=UPI0021665CA4|nr:carboxypeptidase B-like [Anthonomus grandis grandis]